MGEKIRFALQKCKSVLIIVLILWVVLSIVLIAPGAVSIIDAKETNNKTSFPIANIHMHQLKHIENIIRNKGICFLKQTFLSLIFIIIKKVTKPTK